MSSKAVVMKFNCDSKETQTNHVRSKLSEILTVYLKNTFPDKYRDNQNFGPFKYRFRLSIFQINYSIDNIDYRLSHGLTSGCAHIIHTWPKVSRFSSVSVPGNTINSSSCCYFCCVIENRLLLLLLLRLLPPAPSSPSGPVLSGAVCWRLYPPQSQTERNIFGLIAFHQTQETLASEALKEALKENRKV
jgi:hypothetical protein